MFVEYGDHSFHLKRSLVKPPAVEDATSLW